jgi:hypothetical protein
MGCSTSSPSIEEPDSCGYWRFPYHSLTHSLDTDTDTASNPSRTHSLTQSLTLDYNSQSDRDYIFWINEEALYTLMSERCSGSTTTTPPLPHSLTHPAHGTDEAQATADPLTHSHTPLEPINTEQTLATSNSRTTTTQPLPHSLTLPYPVTDEVRALASSSTTNHSLPRSLILACRLWCNQESLLYRLIGNHPTPAALPFPTTPEIRTKARGNYRNITNRECKRALNQEAIFDKIKGKPVPALPYPTNEPMRVLATKGTHRNSLSRGCKIWWNQEMMFNLVLKSNDRI